MAFEVGGNVEQIGLLGNASVTVTNLAGGTLYYADSNQVSATSNQGSLTAGNSATFTETVWVVSASRSSVQLAYTAPATSVTGAITMDSGAAPTVDHVTALTDGNAWAYDQASGKVKGKALLALPAGATAGDLFYYDGSVLQRVAKGSNGQLLQSNGSVPQWATVASGGGGGDPSLAPAAWGFLADCCPLPAVLAAVSNLRPVSGRLSLMRVDIGSSISVSNIVLDVNQAGAGLTAGQNWAGIYSSAGTLVAQTADQTTAWASIGEPMTMALTGAPFALTGGTFVWVAVLSNGTTPVGLRSLTQSLLFNMGLTAATYKCAFNGSGTTLPASITPSSNSSNNVPFWCALS